ncbi:MAG: energy-coupling factor transporter ATPase [Eubacterium sp.]|nr:energy-coupling factor transporter ATPase [Eubacterium sp.]
MGIIRARKLGFDYYEYHENADIPEVRRALRDVDLDIEEGSFIAVLGHNGCGKSTLAKQINALLVPTEGTMWIDSMNTAEGDDLWKIRQEAGMVFQNPDNQIIATVVEEDVGFGPENIGVETDEIWQRVDRALADTGMVAYRKHSPNKLSGGQKQRVAIAGIMAMKPKCIVLDEPTAMLDPNGRKEVIAAVSALNKQEGVTIILITHYMEEVVDADQLFVMDEGRIVMSGTPREVFADVEQLKELRLDVPQVTLLTHELIRSGLPLREGVLKKKELIRQLCDLRGAGENAGKKPEGKLSGQETDHVPEEPGSPKMDKKTDHVPEEPDGLKVNQKEVSSGGSLALDDVSYVYSNGTAYEITALDHVSLEIPQGQFVGIIGHTGSGKSTMVQHFNALIRPTSGRVLFNGQDVWAEGYNRRELRFHVGIVFQYPEHQLFETDVISDVCFGPKNQGLSQEACLERARHALEQVGVPEDLYDNSPFELSGGQKRRIAIAGVLAMDPDVLILDEPTAGLDPRGRDEIFEVIKHLQEMRNMTIVLVSHSMEDVARYVDRLIVMNEARKAFDGTPKEVFAHYRELETMGLAAPQVTYIMHELAEKGFDVDLQATTVEEARDTILGAMWGK